MTTQANDPDAGNYNWRETDPNLWTCQPGSHCKLELFTTDAGAPPKLRVHILVQMLLPSMLQPPGSTWILAHEEKVPPRELDPGDFLSPIASAEISYWDWLRTLGASTLP